NGETGVRLPDNLITSNTYSVSYWINAEQITDFTPTFFGEGHARGWQNVILKHGANPRSFVWTNFFPTEGWNDAFFTAPENVVPINTWVHLGFTVDQGTIKTYLDGELVFTGENYFDIYSDTENNIFGLGVAHVDVPFKGLMDDFKVYPNDVLSESEISAYVDYAKALHNPDAIAEKVLDAVDLGEYVTQDVTLPTTGILGSTITWETSHEANITPEGVVTRPVAGEEDVTVTLTATLTLREKTYTRVYEVIVKAIPLNASYYEYGFEGNLNESTEPTFSGTTTEKDFTVAGGNELYKEGIVGDSVYLDGTTGIRLPDDMIRGSEYTISYWMKPEALTQITPAFFTIKSDAWINFMPERWDSAHLVWVADGEARFFIDTFQPTKLNEWVLVTLTVNGSKATLYENGVEKASINDMPDVFGREGVAHFALGVNTWDIPFKGYIDELKIYAESALSAEEIQAYYDDVMGVISPEDIAKGIFDSITFPNEVDGNLDLPLEKNDLSISWSTSNPHIISSTGDVTRPNIGMSDVTVRLSATVTIDGEVFTRDYEVLVKAMPSMESLIHYTFEDSLIPEGKPTLGGSVTGKLMNEEGGAVSYKPGIDGNALYLDGTSGVLLPDDLITGDQYTISYWMKPEALTTYTSAFFTVKEDAWISFMPERWDSAHLVWIAEGEDRYYLDTFQQTKINEWVMVTLSVNGSNAILYEDGVPKVSITNMPDVFGRDGVAQFALGVNLWDTPFKGLIDELVIVPDVALSSTQIDGLRNDVLSKLTPEGLAKQFFGSLVFGEDNVVTEDLKLPTLGQRGAVITWKSANAKYLTDKGVVTRPETKDGDKVVKLTVTFALEGQTFTHTMDITVKAKAAAVDSVYYDFNLSLEEATKDSALLGKTTTSNLGVLGGTARYREGKVNQGLYLDGTYGVRLPDGLIRGNTYSVSMWLKPEVMSDFSTTFFGAKNNDSWISFTPQGVGSQA
ncbi:MAG: LamG domain-containing protein, partial [Erysipelothrix sp.]|nr:LamG domain-containing protein [Erysipelothrix sp.]